jgi:hypothetical protein
VSGTTWWTSELKQELSQGDVLEGIPGAVLVHPLAYLNPRPAKGGKTVYEQSGVPFEHPGKKGDERQFMLSSGEIAGALILSHDCEIDKSKRVQIAPVFALDSLPPENRLAVLEQRRFSLMPLPDVPKLGTCYADFRLMQPVRRDFLGLENRLASMNTDAVDRLQTQIAMFFTRRKFGGSPGA